MSWIVEQSENAAIVNVNGNTITTNSGGNFPGRINALYKDPANQNGQYFWQLEFHSLDPQDNGDLSVGLTTDQGFQPGWDLKAMAYAGNLFDGGALLVQQFGECIKSNDKIGLLLQLMDADLKLYIFHNDRPLGLAYHVQAPYPKPLCPVIIFNSDGTVKISRSQQIPTALNRALPQYIGIEGHWKISQNAQNPETVAIELQIKKQDQNTYHLHSHVVNNLNCTFELNPTNNQVTLYPLMLTRMAGSPREMQKENTLTKLISNMQSLQVQGEQLVLQTNNSQQVRLERFVPEPPPSVTQNVFNEIQ